MLMMTTTAFVLAATASALRQVPPPLLSSGKWAKRKKGLSDHWHSVAPCPQAIHLAPNLTCDEVSARSEQPDDLRVPSASECKLAVVFAGMPRTASSLLSRMGQAAVQHLQPGAPRLGLYWDAHQHNGMQADAAQEYLHQLKKRLPALGPSGVLLIKSHEFVRGLLHACRKTLVITSHRHPLWNAKSVQAAWIQDGTPTLVDSLRTNLAMQRCWLGTADRVVDVRYKDLRAQGGLRQVATALFLQIAAALGVHPVGVDRFVSKMESMWSAKEANPGIPSTQSDACKASGDDKCECLPSVILQAAERVKEVTASFAARYNYTWDCVSQAGRSSLLGVPALMVAIFLWKC
mmetsp:Transcript_19745/g.57277  ORF Transcript_19745/g.57277 Transcript_19745/m.57277 type:complete len:348 (+) Transcript_19745:77-1120(+)